MKKAFFIATILITALCPSNQALAQIPSPKPETCATTIEGLGRAWKMVDQVQPSDGGLNVYERMSVDMALLLEQLYLPRVDKLCPPSASARIRQNSEDTWRRLERKILFSRPRY